MKSILGVLLTIGVICAFAVSAEDMKMGAMPDHVVLTPDQVKWGPSDFPGLSMAVMQGDPSKAGDEFTVWLKAPAGFKFAPHWHPTDENVVVLEGKLGLGMGDTMDDSGPEAGPGTYARVAKEAHHFAWSKEGAVIAVYGIGPFQINFVNPADDPRPKPAK